MKFPDSTGLLLTIVDGFIGDETMMIHPIDNYHYPFGDFAQKVLTGDESSADLADWLKVPRLYLVVGNREKVHHVEQAWRTKVQQVFAQFLQHKPVLEKIKQKVQAIETYCLESFYWLYLSEGMRAEGIQYPRQWRIENEECVLWAFYWTRHPDDDPVDRVEQSVSFWLDRERPALKGYQCLIRSFVLRNMTGRKVLASIPDSEGNWGLVLEGGLFLPLAYDFEAGLSKLNSSHIQRWTVGEVEEILLDPVYTLGYHYPYPDLVGEWLYVFFYALATMDEDRLTDVDLELLYQRFCDYLGNHICPYIPVGETILDVNEWKLWLKKMVNDIRDYLKGKEETGVSKNILLMLRNRHAYLPAVHRFMQEECGLTAIRTTCFHAWDCDDWHNRLTNLTEPTGSYEKGKRLEDLIQYLIGSVPGLTVTAVRAKQGRAEVDLFCCNVSYDPCLWQLGALILIECKNRKKKAEPADIRNLVPTMEAKGIHAAMIVSRAGFSAGAMEEIEHQLFGGKMILPISLSDLEGVNNEKSAYDLLREKIEEVKLSLENDDRQLHF
ncbi:restriction endonuclease [Desulfitobacterium sp. PCE1]|uniref:restriction endonuclease n=1 Tax=Desulfitobacterium sp. PCE1 TaxID=146907 RepID=UPI000375D591|nr:restriction endonuclease [Desulfitobacterium sp. PCE1]